MGSAFEPEGLAFDPTPLFSRRVCNVGGRELVSGLYPVSNFMLTMCSPQPPTS
jgi:hypothetical protein